ncbi:hypothetical protein lerEdw1_010130 [Lerista edwardsae]|nr:hypothetical protein lerEdw1_010130 [Lerista edwardsae]
MVMERVLPLSVPLAWRVSLLLQMLPLTDSQAPSEAPLPPAPRLSVLPPGQPFTRGQQAWLHCSPPAGRRPEGFVYYKRAGDGWSRQSTLKGSPAEISTRDLEPEETFACGYWEVTRAGGRPQSEQSNTVQLSVRAPPGLAVTEYTFYQRRRGQRPEKLPSSQTGPYAQFYVEDRSAGVYSCEYRVQLSGREAQSQPSNNVTVAVIGRPPPPDLSITPRHSVYQNGESVTLTCSVPGNRVSKSLFFKDGRQVQELTPTSALDTSFPYTLRLTPQDGGTYSCRYHIQEAMRDVSSPDSSTISLQVLGFSVSPARDVYRAGESLLLRCSVPQQPFHGLKVLFFKDQQPLLLTPSLSSKYTFEHTLLLSPRGSGNYSCRYQFEQSGRPVQSRRSRFFQVSVTAPPPSATAPAFSTTCQTAQGHRTAVGLHDSAGTPTASTLLSTSSYVGAGVTNPTHAVDVRISRSQPAGSESSPSQDPPNLTTHSTKPPKVCLFTIALRLHAEVEQPLSSWGFSAAFVGGSKKAAAGSRPALQERDLPQEQTRPGSHDWGLLPKSKPLASNLRDPLKEKEGEEDADSGAEFEFPEIDPTYMLLGFSCSTFRLEENDPPKEEPHTYSEILL